MPTKLKPQLIHSYPPVSFSATFAAIEEGLNTNRERILDTIGFNREYREPKSFNARDLELYYESAEELLGELLSILAKAAFIAFGVSTQSPNQLIANLEAIEREPGLLVAQRATMDPALLVSVAMKYQRSKEPPGMFAHEITEGFGAEPSEEAISLAARAAIDELKAGPRKRGARSPRYDIRYLAKDLAGIYRRFQSGGITRRVTNISKNGGNEGEEYGPFLEFLNVTIPTLVEFVKRTNARYDISKDSLIRTAWELQKEAEKEAEKEAVDKDER